MAVSIARILIKSILSPRYSVLLCVLISIFDIRFSRVSFSITPAVFLAGGWADPPPAEHLKL